MVTRKISFAPDEFYHVYNRGTDKRVIFQDAADYQRFVELLYLSNSTKSVHVRSIRKTHPNIFDFDRGETQVAIGAYCLMPNHFHLLLKQKEDAGISNFMNKLGTSYSMYFNRRNDRTGILFQGRYKAEWADSDEYLKYLFSYIHLNPIKLIQNDWKEKGIQDASVAMRYLEAYVHSSFLDYEMGSKDANVPTSVKRKEERILDKGVFPEYFKTPEAFKSEILEWIQFKKDSQLT